MKCNRKKPDECFNCPYSDCIDEETDKTESEIRQIADALKEKKPVSPANKKKYQYVRRWLEEHPGYFKEYGREYREKNAERLKKYRREYYLAHKADMLEKQRIYDARKKKRKAAANA